MIPDLGDLPALLANSRLPDHLRDATQKEPAAMPLNTEPEWAPLRSVLPLAECDDWMWMYAQVRDGRVIQSYKHRVTRGYLHLDQTGQAWRFEPGEQSCDPWCEMDHEHDVETPSTPVALSWDEAREWAWI